MGKSPSLETELRHAKRDIKTLRDRASVLLLERDSYRVRASKAEAEAAEWQRRFDLLLGKLKVELPLTTAAKVMGTDEV